MEALEEVMARVIGYTWLVVVTKSFHNILDSHALVGFNFELQVWTSIGAENDAGEGRLCGVLFGCSGIDQS